MRSTYCGGCSVGSSGSGVGVGIVGLVGMVGLGVGGGSVPSTITNKIR